MTRTIISPCNLAFETWDDIITFLSSDPHALAACARTCHAFLPAARDHLFHVARIDSPQRLGALEPLLGASPDLARSIRILEVRRGSGALGSDDTLQTHCAKEGWPRLTTRLERLSCVRLQGFAFEIPEQVGTAGLQSVRTVWLKNMRSVGDDLRSFVLACPQLQSLYIDGTSDVAESTPPSTPLSDSNPASFSQLDTLVWHVPSLPLLMQSRRTEDPPMTLPLLISQRLQTGQTTLLRRLAVGHNLRLSVSMRNAVSQLVAFAGDALESLVLRLEDLGEGRSPGDIPSALLPELSANRRLKSLHILAVGSAWFEIRDGLSAITHVLSTVPADEDALEDVVIHLTPYFPWAKRDWSLEAWLQLVAALVHFGCVHPRVRCTLCLDFSSNFGERPKPVDERPIADYVQTLAQALPPCRSDGARTHVSPKIGLIWQTHFRDWERTDAEETYPEHNYVGVAMGAPAWYYRLRYCAL